jgi:hypothetical protein
MCNTHKSRSVCSDAFCIKEKFRKEGNGREWKGQDGKGRERKGAEEHR